MSFSFKNFYATLERLPQLCNTDPRQGCITRTQMIGSLLHEQGIKVGRAWVLPLFEANSFIAPLCGAKGVPLKIADADGMPQLVRWRFHCSTVLLDEPEQLIIDFPLFAAPVSLSKWEKIFTDTQKRFTPKGNDINELRIITHAFADIPQRQVLRYNPQAQKQNKLLPSRIFAKQLLCQPFKPFSMPLPYVRHQG